MLKIKQILKKEETIIIVFISIYNLINWILFVNVERLASPDFYKYYFEFEKLISGELFFKNSPPLFILLMGLGGKFLNLFWEGESSIIERKNSKVIFLKEARVFRETEILSYDFF